MNTRNVTIFRRATSVIYLDGRKENYETPRTYRQNDVGRESVPYQRKRLLANNGLAAVRHSEFVLCRRTERTT